MLTLSQKLLLLNDDSDPVAYDRKHIINVQGNFLNLYDSQGVPIWDAFIPDLFFNDKPRANEWMQRLLDAGTTHFNLNLSGDYAENLGWCDRYPVFGMDFTNNLENLYKVIEWVLSKNQVINLHLAADGHSYDPVGQTYGWSWGMLNLPEIMSRIKAMFPKSILWNTGWDGCYPAWTPDELLAFLKMMRNVLGEDEQIATEMSGPGSWGYCHLGNGASDWTKDKLGMLDVLLLESSGIPVDEDGLQQTLARMLGPNKKNIEPKNDGPDYLVTMRDVKEIVTCCFETAAFAFSRKKAQEVDARTAASRAAYYGCTSFGNGLPL